MNTRLLFGLLWLTPTICFGALSTTTSYFLNVEALTNVTARSAVRGLTGVFTNSVSAAGFNTSGTTNATLTGNLLANGATFTNGITSGASTFTGAVGFANGTGALPSISFASDTSLGFYRFASGQIGVGVGGGIGIRISNAALTLKDNFTLGWSPDPGTVAAGLNVVRDADNTLQLGSDSATPAAQTIKGPDGSGSNIAGGPLRLDGGYSTGTGIGGALVLRTANSAGGTSSSINTASERFHAAAKWVTLTSATATTLFTIPVPATNYVGLTATVTVYATDGTDHQSKTSVITVDAIAKTTTITPTISQVDNTTAASAGTLTCTYTAVDNTSNVLAVKATADSSLTETVLRAKIVITAINASGTGLVTEQ